MSKHICWYRINTSKSNDRSVHVGLCVAWKANPGMPKIKLDDPKSWVRNREVYADVTQEYVQRLYEIATIVSEKVKDAAAKLGATPGNGLDSTLKYMSVEAQHVDYVNFFWIDMYIPFIKGQKATVQKLVEVLTNLQSEFAGDLTLEFKNEAR